MNNVNERLNCLIYGKEKDIHDTIVCIKVPANKDFSFENMLAIV